MKLDQEQREALLSVWQACLDLAKAAKTVREHSGLDEEDDPVWLIYEEYWQPIEALIRDVTEPDDASLVLLARYAVVLKRFTVGNRLPMGRKYKVRHGYGMGLYSAVIVPAPLIDVLALALLGVDFEDVVRNDEHPTPEAVMAALKSIEETPPRQMPVFGITSDDPRHLKMSNRLRDLQEAPGLGVLGLPPAGVTELGIFSDGYTAVEDDEHTEATDGGSQCADQGSSNGRTAGSDSANHGSSPCP